MGDHALACGGNSDRIVRHNVIKDVIFTAAQSAALSPRQEAPSLVPDSLSRPADVFLPHWLQGRPAALNVTIISQLQSQTLSQAASTQGAALLVAEHRKRVVHLEDCQRRVLHSSHWPWRPWGVESGCHLIHFLHQL
uniref:Uncharacterized protein n=1 Tax=Amphimedon queenslandica TaxID=400682 RepID=A0A1X7T0W1_AMPQE